jgi:hypothetical protein
MPNPSWIGLKRKPKRLLLGIDHGLPCSRLNESYVLGKVAIKVSLLATLGSESKAHSV